MPRKYAIKYLYFLGTEPGNDLVKIGASATPCGRLETIQQWSPLRLKLLAEVECETRYESMVQSHFAGDHLHGEWFYNSDELRTLIAGINAGKSPDKIISLKKNGNIKSRTIKNKFGHDRYEYGNYLARLGSAREKARRAGMSKADEKHFILARSILLKWGENRNYDYDRPDWPQLEYVEKVMGYWLQSEIDSREARNN